MVQILQEKNYFEELKAKRLAEMDAQSETQEELAETQRAQGGESTSLVSAGDMGIEDVDLRYFFLNGKKHVWCVIFDIDYLH